MGLFLWFIIFYLVIGFVIYFSTVKGIRRRTTFIKATIDSQEGSKNTTFVVWWIVGVTIWGVVGIFLIVSWFLANAG